MFIEFQDYVLIGLGEICSSVPANLFIQNLLFLFLSFYVAWFGFNLLLLNTKKGILGAFFVNILTPALQTFLTIFVLLWVDCFRGRREEYFPFLCLAELGVTIYMVKLVVRIYNHIGKRG